MFIKGQNQVSAFTVVYFTNESYKVRVFHNEWSDYISFNRNIGMQRSKFYN